MFESGFETTILCAQIGMTSCNNRDKPFGHNIVELARILQSLAEL